MKKIENNFERINKLRESLDPDNKIKNEIADYFKKIDEEKKYNPDECEALGKLLAKYFEENKEKFNNNPEFFIFFIRYTAVNSMNPDSNDLRKIVGLFTWEAHHEIIKDFAKTTDWINLTEEKRAELKKLQLAEFQNLLENAQNYAKELSESLEGEASAIKFIKLILEKLPSKEAKIFTPFDLLPPVVNIFRTNASKLNFINQAEEFFQKLNPKSNQNKEQNKDKKQDEQVNGNNFLPSPLFF